MARPTICLPADVLRSSGLEILGSGPGTIPLAEITGAIPEFMSLAAAGDLPIDIDEVPLAEVGPAVASSQRRPADRLPALNTAAIQKALCSLRAAIRHEPEQAHGARHER